MTYSVLPVTFTAYEEMYLHSAKRKITDLRLAGGSKGTRHGCWNHRKKTLVVREI